VRGIAAGDPGDRDPPGQPRPRRPEQRGAHRAPPQARLPAGRRQQRYLWHDGVAVSRPAAGGRPPGGGAPATSPAGRACPPRAASACPPAPSGGPARAGPTRVWGLVRGAVVGAVWAGMVAATLWLVVRYGLPVPFLDEYAYIVPVLHGGQPVTPAWLWEQYG